jgi:hypothetical protein
MLRLEAVVCADAARKSALTIISSRNSSATAGGVKIELNSINIGVYRFLREIFII